MRAKEGTKQLVLLPKEIPVQSMEVLEVCSNEGTKLVRTYIGDNSTNTTSSNRRTGIPYITDNKTGTTRILDKPIAE